MERQTFSLSLHATRSLLFCNSLILGTSQCIIFCSCQFWGILLAKNETLKARCAPLPSHFSHRSCLSFCGCACDSARPRRLAVFSNVFSQSRLASWVASVTTSRSHSQWRAERPYRHTGRRRHTGTRLSAAFSLRPASTHRWRVTSSTSCSLLYTRKVTQKSNCHSCLPMMSEQIPSSTAALQVPPSADGSLQIAP